MILNPESEPPFYSLRNTGIQPWMEGDCILWLLVTSTNDYGDRFHEQINNPTVADVRKVCLTHDLDFDRFMNTIGEMDSAAHTLALDVDVYKKFLEENP